jgi:hypothetical protein
MKRNFYNFLFIYMLGLFLGSNNEVFSQNSIDFSFEKTGPNHSILVLPVWHPVIKELEQSDSLPTDLILGFDSDSLDTGDLVGVFHMNKNGEYKCAGSLSWKSNDFNMLPVWGEYPQGSDNGMEMGEKMIWLAQKKDNLIYEIEASYQKPLMAIYLKDGASAVLGMRLKLNDALSPSLIIK